jgi:hypothetical protein
MTATTSRGRKTRDTTPLAEATPMDTPEAFASKVAALFKAGTRTNGKKTMSVKQAARILSANGAGVADQDAGEVAALAVEKLSNDVWTRLIITDRASGAVVVYYR